MDRSLARRASGGAPRHHPMISVFPSCPLSASARRVERVLCVGTVACALAWLTWNGVLRCRMYYASVHQFRAIIKPGWLPFSNGMDLTDLQWRSWRANLPYLLVLTLVPVLFKRQFAPGTDVDASRKVRFMAWWGLAFACVLHGTGVLFLLAVLLLNFAVANRAKGSRLAPVWAWTYCLLLLFLSKVWGNQYWEDLLTRSGLGFAAKQPTFRQLFGDSVGVLDSLGGFYAWVNPLNLSFLRLISYNMDVHKLHSAHSGHRKEQSCPSLGRLPLLQYLAYLLYPPLYISGPILTYESFLDQLPEEKERGHSERAENRVEAHVQSGQAMLLRALGYAAALEVVLHYLHYHAMSHNIAIIFHKLSKSYFYLPPWEVMLLGFFTLNFMYVKFLVIWRVASSIALMDGFVTVDNMNRCVCNNYTFAGFWRSWHASLHKWVIRYLYVPLGGRPTQMLTIGPIFCFIAVWHDLELRWIVWASLNCVCFVCEALLSLAFKSQRLDGLRGTLFWRYASAVVAVCNIYLLMLCNLAILYGFEGSYDFVTAFVFPPKEYSQWYEGLQCNAIGALWLFCGVLLMFQVRESERASGKLKRF